MKTTITALCNQKGGVGKTTSCLNLGVGLAQEGKKVLLVDCDPQGGLTISTGCAQPDSLQDTPSLSQAQRLKRFSQDGKLTEDMVLAIMSEQKKLETERIVLQSRQISQYFSPSATPKEMETSILSMLDTAKEWRSYFPEDNTLDDVNRRMRKVLEGMKRTKSRAPER